MRKMEIFVETWSALPEWVRFIVEVYLLVSYLTMFFFDLAVLVLTTNEIDRRGPERDRTTSIAWILLSILVAVFWALTSTALFALLASLVLASKIVDPNIRWPSLKLRLGPVNQRR